MLADITNARQRRKCRRTSSKSTEVVSIERFVANRSNKNPKELPKKRKAAVDAREKAAKQLKPSIVLPPPENGIIYTPREAFRHLKLLQRKERSSIIDRLVESQEILVKRQQMYRLLRDKDNESQLRSWWNMKGRPTVVTQEDLVRDIRTELLEQVGNSWGRDEVEKILTKWKSKKIQEAGFVPINVQVSQQTVKNYVALLSQNPNLTTNSTVLNKTNQRYTADHSLNSAVTFLFIVATNHYIIGTPCDPKICKKMTEGARLLMDKVSDYHGGIAVCPVHPADIKSMDDKVQYVYEGENHFCKEVFLASKACLKEKGVQSQYRCRPVEGKTYLGGL